MNSSKLLKSLALSSIILGAGAQLTQAAEIGEGLQEALNSEGKSTVIITFKDKMNRNKLAKKSSKAEIQRTLMASYEASIREFRSQKMSKRSDVKVLDHNWVANSVVLEASHSSLQEILKHPEIEHATLDYEIQFEEPVEQYKGETLNTKWTYGLQKMGVDDVYHRWGYTGKGVKVGVLDTGIDPNHPDLKGKIIAWKDFAGNAATGKDAHGHGTHCAGTIAGGDSSGTRIGVAPDAKLYIGRIFGDSGATSKSKILKGMKWMADPDGNPDTNDQPDLVSNSWGGPALPYLLERSTWKVVKTWRSLGIVPVFAAGNSGSNEGTMSTPGGYPHSFAVGATDSDDKIAYFSSRGPIKWSFKTYIKPDISAPGVQVYSAKPGGSYQYMSGTSMATPHVAGLIAILLEAKPNLSVSQIESLLMSTSLDLGESGKDNSFGQGRADLVKAVERLSGKSTQDTKESIFEAVYEK